MAGGDEWLRLLYCCLPGDVYLRTGYGNGGSSGGQSSYRESLCFHSIAKALAAPMDGDESVAHDDALKGGVRYYWRW